MHFIPWAITVSTVWDIVASAFFPPPPIGPTLLLSPPSPVMSMVPVFQQNFPVFASSIDHLKHKHLQHKHFRRKAMMMLGLSDVGQSHTVFQPVIKQGTYRPMVAVNNMGFNNVVPRINDGVNRVAIGGQAILQDGQGNSRTMPARGSIVYVRQSRVNPANDIMNSGNVLNNNNNNNIINNNNNNNIETLRGTHPNSGFNPHGTIVDPTFLRGSRTLVAARGRVAPVLAVPGQENVVIGNREARPVNTIIDSSVHTQEIIRGATNRDALYSRGAGQNTVPLGPGLTRQSNNRLGQQGQGKLLPGAAMRLPASTELDPSTSVRSGEAFLPIRRGRIDANLNQRVYTPTADRNVIGTYNVGQNINSGMNLDAIANTNIGADAQTILGVRRNRILPNGPGGFDKHAGLNPAYNIINNALNNNNNNNNNRMVKFDNNRGTLTGRAQTDQILNTNSNNNNNQFNMNDNTIPTSVSENVVPGNSIVDIAGIEFIGRRGGGQGAVGTFDTGNLNSGLNNRNIGQTVQVPPALIGGNNNNFESAVGPVDRIIYADQQVSADRQLRAGNTLSNGNNNLNAGTSRPVDMNNQLTTGNTNLNVGASRTVDINNQLSPLNDLSVSASRAADINNQFSLVKGNNNLNIGATGTADMKNQFIEPNNMNVGASGTADVNNQFNPSNNLNVGTSGAADINNQFSLPKGNNNLDVGANRAVDVNNQFGPAYDIASSAAQPATQVGVDVSTGVVDQSVGIDIRTDGQSVIGSPGLNNNNNNNNNFALNGDHSFNNQNNQNTFSTAQDLNPQNALNDAQGFNNQNVLHNPQDFNNQEAYNSLQSLGPKDIFRQPLTGRTLDFRFMGSQSPPLNGGSQTAGSGMGGGHSIEISIDSDLAQAANIGVDVLGGTNLNHQNTDFANAAPHTNLNNQNNDFANTAPQTNLNSNQNTEFAYASPPVDTIPTPSGGLNTVIPMEGVAVASTGMDNLVNSAVDAHPSSTVADAGPLVVTDLAAGANAAGDTFTGPFTDKTAGSVLERKTITASGDPISNAVVDKNAFDMNQIGNILAQNQSGTLKLLDLPPGNKISSNAGIQVFEVTSDINGILAGSTVHDLGPVDVFSVNRGKTKSGQGGNVQIVVIDGAQAGGLLGKGVNNLANTELNNIAPIDRAPLRIGAQSINMSGVGRLGKSVGSVPADSGKVLGVFSLPSGLQLPTVDPSVSAIPESIERAAAVASAGPSAQPHSHGGTPP